MKTLITLLISTLLFTQSINEEKKAQRMAMLDKVFITLEQNIANPEWLEAESFATFKEFVYSDSVLTLNDKDFNRAFNKATWDLPFTHFQIFENISSSSESKKSDAKKSNEPVSWEEISDHTAYLKIKSFSIPGSIVNTAVQEIGLINMKI